jgi:hypothetical protein
MAGTESEDFNLGKMVGEAMGRIDEQERIIGLIEDTELTFIDPLDNKVKRIDMDWTELFEQIRREQ